MKGVLKKGSVVTIGGFPFELVQDTVAESHASNFAVLFGRGEEEEEDKEELLVAQTTV